MSAIESFEPVNQPNLMSQSRVTAAAIAMVGGLAALILFTQTPTLAALFLTGTLMGLVLYHATFGFTSAFRVLLADGQSAGLRAQLMMLGLACTLFFPTLAAGNLFGQPVVGSVSPVATSVVVGAFMFGVGMQMGGGCASGTLFAVGGGGVRMIVTLAFFIVGSVIGLFHNSWWQSLPALPPISLVKELGWETALALNLGVFAIVWVVVSAIEKRRHGVVDSIFTRGSLLRGPWPLVGGAIALALLNFLTLYLAGRPWGVTAAFGLWGGKILYNLGFAVDTWVPYSSPAQQKALTNSVLGDVTSVMNIGIMLGALAAAGLAHKFNPVWRIPLRHLLASVLGGLLLGYGARMAYGCNIGAFFSGISSGSVHGWLWIASCLVGNYAGLRLRPFFDLPIERKLTAC